MNIHELYIIPNFSDIKFLIGPARKSFHAHRILLAARSEVFRAMFCEQNQQKHAKDNGEIPFVLSDIAPEIFMAMMEFIYTNCVTLNSKIVSHYFLCVLVACFIQIRKKIYIYILFTIIKPF